MGFLSTEDPSLERPSSMIYGHGLVDADCPIGKEDVIHVVIPCLYHLDNFPKLINIGWGVSVSEPNFTSDGVKASFVVELVEGKGHNLQAGPLEFEDIGLKTVGLLLRMMKSYFATGKYVILDSGFCVLKWLIQLGKKGDFACAVLQNRRYWPEMVPSKDTEDHFWEVEVGEKDAIQGKVDGVI